MNEHEKEDAADSPDVVRGATEIARRSLALFCVYGLCGTCSIFAIQPVR
jgi:hypothetical protein